MLITPLILAWMRGGRPDLRGRPGLEAGAIGVSLLLSSVVLFSVLEGYEYAVVPLVGWAALRWGPRGASAGSILVGAVAMWYTVHGVGPFVRSGGEGLWGLELFLALLSTGSLVIGAMATALRESELRFRRIFEHAGVGMAVVRPDGRIGEANPAFQRMLNSSAAELAGRTIAEITHPDDWAVGKTMLKELLAGHRAPLRVVKRYLRSDGTVFWGKLTATHIGAGGGATGFSVGLVEDISEQRAAEEALRDSERQYRSLFEFSPDAVLLCVPRGEILAANPAACRMFGRTEDEIRALGRTAIVDQRDPRTEPALQELEQNGVFRGELTLLRKDGSPFDCELTSVLYPGKNGQMHSSVIARDVTQRRSSEAELQRTTHTMQALVEAAPLAIYTLDAQGRVRTWNHAAEQMFGWAAGEVIGQLLPIVPPEALDSFQEALRCALESGAVTGIRVQRCRRDGLMLDLRVCAAPTRGCDGSVDGVIALAEDVTERTSLGEQLRQAQKMDAVGQLTGGIAHDFNNILTLVVTNAALLIDDLAPEQTEMRAEAVELQRAALRGAELVRKLMAFSRRRPIELSAVDLVEVVRDTERALRRLLPESVEISSQLEAGPLTISGDVGGIEQMLFNLATNARDAMPEGGTLRLGVYRAWLDEEHRRTHGWGVAGEYVVVAVSDTGCGMSPETRARVFEPFFTTKEPGKGTGLGMSMVYGLMKQHDAYIGLYSELGHGTTFRLYFPAVASIGRGSQVETQAAAPRGGTERILVVDDEPGIRRSAVRVLTRFGYEVEEAADGESALEALSRSKTRYDLILSDLIMPRMGGLALYEELAKRSSGCCVLLMSGYTAEDVHALSDAHQGLRLLHKPWTVTDLLRRVREALDVPPEASPPLRPRVRGAA
jgi:PAS domain S-box-containing protein